MSRITAALRDHAYIAIGVVLTLIFVFACVTIGKNEVCPTGAAIRPACKTNYEIFLQSPPNEKGDVLAGLAGSLAFLWIIITVLQQSQELRLQRTELRGTKEALSQQTILLANAESSRKASEVGDHIVAQISSLKSLLDRTDIQKISMRKPSPGSPKTNLNFVTQKWINHNFTLPLFQIELAKFSKAVRGYRALGFIIIEKVELKRWQEALLICGSIMDSIDYAPASVRELAVREEKIGELQRTLESVLDPELWETHNIGLRKT